MKQRFIVSVLVAAHTSLALAQQSSAPAAEPQPVTGVELKGKAPVNPKTLQVSLPRPQEAVLDNGLRIALLEDHKLPTFALQLVISGGGLADPVDKRGIAMVAAALLREGTKQRTSRDIAEQLATLGSSLNAGATPSSGESIVTVAGLREHLDATLALAADVVMHPAFPQSEVDKFRTRFLAQLQYQRSLPNFMAQEQFMRAVYGEHPGSYVVPPAEVVQGLNSADLAAYHARYYRPNNAILLIYGDVTLKDAVASVRKTLGEWPRAETARPALPPLSPPAKSRVWLIDRPGSVQTSLWLGGLGIERKSDDYFAVLVMNHILGGGPASRLFINLREDKGYTYGVSSSFTGSMFPGVMVASTDVRNEVTEGALSELANEVRRIANEPVSAQELTNAKRALIGRFALSLESPQALLGNLATQKIYDLPPDYWDEYPRRVEAISPADIQRVAKQYYDPARLQIVAVGDGAALRETLAKYGEVHAVTGAK